MGACSFQRHRQGLLEEILAQLQPLRGQLCISHTSTLSEVSHRLRCRDDGKGTNCFLVSLCSITGSSKARQGFSCRRAA